MTATETSKIEKMDETLSFLMSRFAVHQSQWQIEAIVEHLQMLVELTRGYQQKRYAGLLAIWRNIHDTTELEKSALNKHGWRVSLMGMLDSRRSKERMAVGY